MCCVYHFVLRFKIRAVVTVRFCIMKFTQLSKADLNIDITFIARVMAGRIELTELNDGEVLKEKQ